MVTLSPLHCSSGYLSDATLACAQVRAVVEGQFLSMRLHAESIGISQPRRLIATGGASANPALCQVLADVFGAPVFVAAQARAREGVLTRFLSP